MSRRQQALETAEHWLKVAAGSYSSDYVAGAYSAAAIGQGWAALAQALPDDDYEENI